MNSSEIEVRKEEKAEVKKEVPDKTFKPKEKVPEPEKKMIEKPKEAQAPKEIYWGTPEAKALPSYKSYEIKSKEVCEHLNRAWKESHDRCMRVC